MEVSPFSDYNIQRNKVVKDSRLTDLTLGAHSPPGAKHGCCAADKANERTLGDKVGSSPRETRSGGRAFYQTVAEGTRRHGHIK